MGKIITEKIGSLQKDDTCETGIPAIDGSKIYRAPDRIIHYIRHHRFALKSKYCDAVMQFDMQSSWSGNYYFNLLTQG